MVVISENKPEEYKERFISFMVYVIQFKIGELWIDKKRFLLSLKLKGSLKKRK